MPLTLKILEDKEFDRLPFKYAKEALGATDYKSGIAYVRNTHWGEISKTINLLTIQHELEELVAKTSPHEEDGIRYKKGGAARNILPTVLAIAGQMIGIPAPLTYGVAMGSKIGMDEYARGRHPTELGQPGTFGGIATSGVQGALSAYGGTAIGKGIQGGMAGWSAAGQQPGATLLSKAGGAVQGAFTGTGTSAIGTKFSLLGPGGKSVGLLGPAAIGTSGMTTNVAGGLTKSAGIAGGDILKGLTNPMTMLGLGSMSMAALPTSTTPPNLGDIVGKWLTADTVTRAGARAKDIADVKYTGDFMPSKEITAFIDVMGKDIDKAYKQRAIDLDRMGLAMSDQFMNSGERLEMHRRLGEENQREKDVMQSQWLLSAKQQYSQDQYNYIIGRLNADEATKRDLLYGELSDVIWKYNIQEADLMNFRKIAADAGLFSAAKGMGIV